jgi:hypothetical protein
MITVLLERNKVQTYENYFQYNTSEYDFVLTLSWF